MNNAKKLVRCINNLMCVGFVYVVLFILVSGLRSLKLSGHAGFDSLPDELVNKSVQNGCVFNIMCIGETGAFEDETNWDLCNFFDTINITDGHRNRDDSITFEGVQYANESYGTFNCTYTNHVKIETEGHIRGCICQYKNCVRLCCPYGNAFIEQYNVNSVGHVCLRNSKVREIDLEDYGNMVFVSEMPCLTGFLLDPTNEPLHEWKILQNGSLFISENNQPLVVDRNDYCLANILNQITNQFNVMAMLCSKGTTTQETQQIVLHIIYKVAMLVSVIFYILTFLVYLWIDELRQTVHGKP